MTAKKITKADLIAVLVQAKRGTHTGLQRATLAGLQAMVNEIPGESDEPMPSAEPVIDADNNVAENVGNKPAPRMVLAERLTSGLTVVGTRKRIATRKIGRVAVGTKFVTIWDESGKDFGYWPLGAKVEVIA